MKTIIVAVLLAMLVAMARADTCSSSFVSSILSNYTSQATLTCPIGYMNIADGNNGRTCATVKSVYDSKLGKACTNSADCIFGSLTCVDSVCVNQYTRIEGDACTKKESCTPTFKFNSMNCYSGKCQQYSYTTAGKGEACGSVDNSKNTAVTCSSGNTCYGVDANSRKCYSYVYLSTGSSCTIGGKLDSTAYTITACDPAVSYCGSDSTCKAYTFIQKGNDCSSLPKEGTACIAGTICRKKSSSAATKTCEAQASWNEYCEASTECLTGVNGMARCAKNVCIRKNSLKDDAACEANADCWSGLCSSGKCVANTGACSTTTTCPTGACACGGVQYDSANAGKCIATCEGFVADAQACLWNYGVDSTSVFLPSYGASQVIDDSSSAFAACASYIQNVYTCYKSVQTAASITSTVSSTTLGSSKVDLSAAAATVPTSVLMPIVRSGASAVFVSAAAMIVAVLAILF